MGTFLGRMSLASSKVFQTQVSFLWAREMKQFLKKINETCYLLWHAHRCTCYKCLPEVLAADYKQYALVLHWIIHTPTPPIFPQVLSKSCLHWIGFCHCVFHYTKKPGFLLLNFFFFFFLQCLFYCYFYFLLLLHVITTWLKVLKLICL